MYEERPSALAGAVVWSRVRVPGGTARVLPDGCMDVILRNEQLVVAGPDTRAHLITEQPGDSFTGLRFAPGTGPAVFGIPAHELRDSLVPLGSLWPAREVAELTERVAGAADPGRALEAVARGRLRRPGGPRQGPDPLAGRVAAGLRRGQSVAATARAVGLGERQLRRRCLDAFGYGPKTLARVLRLQCALELARAGEPAVEAATRAGYADQAHLAREVRSLAGVPLTVLLRGRQPERSATPQGLSFGSGRARVPWHRASALRTRGVPMPPDPAH